MDGRTDDYDPPRLTFYVGNTPYTVVVMIA